MILEHYMVQGHKDSLNQFFASDHGSVQKGETNLVMICSVHLSPPPASTIPTPSAFTDEQKAFVGPHHGPNIFRQKLSINH